MDIFMDIFMAVLICAGAGWCGWVSGQLLPWAVVSLYRLVRQWMEG